MENDFFKLAGQWVRPASARRRPTFARWRSGGIRPVAAAIRHLLLLLLFALALPAAAPAPAPPPVDAPALWEVRAGESTAYLFGTVHALPRGVNWFKPEIAQALDRSKMLVLEAEVPTSAAALAPIILRLSRLPAARPVAERVPEGWRPALLDAIQDLKAGPLDWYDTWFIALTLTNLQAERNGFDPRLGVEAVLTERANMQKIPVFGLETIDEQLINFDALSEADQQLILVYTLAELANSKQRLQAVIDDWLAGRTDLLAAHVNEQFEHSPMLRRMLVEDRNIRWADQLQQRMQAEKGPIFVAVGAGHLAGRGSLIDLLRQRGMTVNRVAPPVKTSAKAPTKAPAGR